MNNLSKKIAIYQISLLAPIVVILSIELLPGSQTNSGKKIVMKARLSSKKNKLFKPDI
jgi:hypothetical protein